MYTDVHLLLKHTCLKTHFSSSLCISSCLAYVGITTVTHSCNTHHVLYQTHTPSLSQTCTHAHTLKFTQRGSCVEYRANASDLKVSPLPQMWHQLVLSLALPLLSPTPFLFLILFHQLSPSFDTSEGVPHMPVTSPLLHQLFLPSSLSRACVSVWNLCTL